MKLVKLYEKMSGWPLGRLLFSKVAAWKAPYFKSIHPFISELTQESCIVEIRKRRSVLNHLGTMHAIAMCNACELAFGMTMEAGLRRDLRWIPKGMTVRYLKKANTDLRAECIFPEVSRLSLGDHLVPVKVFDKNRIVVMEADITVYVSEKK